ncbi:hypothetical protein HPB50_000696 [Hyalomma asiaticum]|uniref:Uncharacterized protein n=1 Tax=Hyalomma asiaticum TaxID=266040 RepID=A0ACB7SJ83_HYAAI|nr:hypothetical protein HPB50_000696 [Hyalomma asiaticum]
MLLVVNNCSTHDVRASLQAVALLFLLPNTTSKLQLPYLGRIVESLLTAADHPATNLLLRVSLYSALGMVKVVWLQVMATCVQNYFCKASFIDVRPDAEPKRTTLAEICGSTSSNPIWVGRSSAGMILFWQTIMPTLKNCAWMRVLQMKYAAKFGGIG